MSWQTLGKKILWKMEKFEGDENKIRIDKTEYKCLGYDKEEEYTPVNMVKV